MWHIFPHTSLHNTLFADAVYTVLVPRKEAPALIPSSSSHPTDILLPNRINTWPNTTGWDQFMTSYLQQATLLTHATQKDTFCVWDLGCSFPPLCLRIPSHQRQGEDHHLLWCAEGVCYLKKLVLVSTGFDGSYHSKPQHSHLRLGGYGNHFPHTFCC